MGHQHRQIGILQHVAGHAAEHELAQPAMRVGAHDQQTAAHAPRFGENMGTGLDRRHVGAREIDRAFDLDEQLRNVDAIFARVFAAPAA